MHDLKGPALGPCITKHFRRIKCQFFLYRDIPILQRSNEFQSMYNTSRMHALCAWVIARSSYILDPYTYTCTQSKDILQVLTWLVKSNAIMTAVDPLYTDPLYVRNLSHSTASDASHFSVVYIYIHEQSCYIAMYSYACVF